MRKISLFARKRGGLIRYGKFGVKRASETAHSVVNSTAVHLMQNPLLTGLMARVGSFKLPMCTKAARISKAYGGPSYRVTEGVFA